MEENKELTEACIPNYEREYYRITKENAQLVAENNILRKTIIEMCKNLFVKCSDEG